MRILQDLIEAFLWPPGSLFLLLAILGCIALIARRRPLIAPILLWASALVLYGFSIEVISSQLLANLENRIPAYSLLPGREDDDNATIMPTNKSTVIVVLGGGSIPGSPDGIGIAPDALSRLSGGFLLHRFTDAPIIVSGGVVRQRLGSVSEAELAADWLAAAGVAADKIITEPASTTTAENARYVTRLLSPEFPDILLVTSAYHMPRSLYSFQDYPGRVYPVPVDYKAVRAPRIAQSFLPSISNLRHSTMALREFLGLVVYAARIH